MAREMTDSEYESWAQKQADKAEQWRVANFVGNPRDMRLRKKMSPQGIRDLLTQAGFKDQRPQASEIEEHEFDGLPCFRAYLFSDCPDLKRDGILIYEGFAVFLDGTASAC